MDKYEFNTRIDQIKKSVLKKDFTLAAKTADMIDWTRVKNNSILLLAADAYEADGQYDKAKEVLLIAYRRTPMGRQLAYRLAILSVKLGDFVDADEFYMDFTQIAPMDTAAYILKYRIAKGRGEPAESLIKILEAYNEVDMEEKWAYVLAKLYDEVGDKEKCVSTCDEISLWFNEGVYVTKALKLKQKYTPLTRGQAERLNISETKSFKPVKDEADDNIKADEIKVKEISVNGDDTIDIQQTIADGMKAILAHGEAGENEAVREDSAESEYNGTVRNTGSILNPIYKMEGDGQISLDTDKDEKTPEKQITGQLDLEAVLKDLENRGILNSRTVSSTVDVMDKAAEVVEQAKSETEEYLSERRTTSLMETIDQISGDEDIDEIVEEAEQGKEPEPKEQIELFEEPDMDIIEPIDESELAIEMIDEEVIDDVSRAFDQVFDRAFEQEPETDEEEIVEIAETEVPEAAADNVEEKTAEDTGVEVPEAAADNVEEETAEDVEAVAAEETVEEAAEEPVENVEAEAAEESVENVEAEVPEKPVEGSEAAVVEEIVEDTGAEEEPVEEPQKQADETKQEKPVSHNGKMKLSDDDAEYFASFLTVTGLEDNLAKAMESLSDTEKLDGTSAANNIIIMGDEKSGKTTLAIDFLKKINKKRAKTGRRIAKVNATALNNRGFKNSLTKLLKCDLIIEDASRLDDDTVSEIIAASKYYTDDMIIILEDLSSNMKRFIENYPEIEAMFGNKFVLKEFNLNEWVKYAEKYAEQQGYMIDPVGKLALAQDIDEIYGINQGMEKEDVQEIIDNAIERNKRKLGRKISRIFAGKSDEPEPDTLKERDFL